jgi:hypothetical protein
MRKLIILADDVCELTPEWLRERGFGAVLCDLDNTLAGYRVTEPDDAVREWIQSLKDANIPLVIVSNAGETRVAAFCDPLGLPYTARAGKPKAKRLLENGAENAVMVGDQFFTDGLAGRRAGMQVVLVPPRVSNWVFAFRRLLEKPFIRRYT